MGRLHMLIVTVEHGDSTTQDSPHSTSQQSVLFHLVTGRHRSLNLVSGIQAVWGQAPVPLAQICFHSWRSRHRKLSLLLHLEFAHPAPGALDCVNSYWLAGWLIPIAGGVERSLVRVMLEGSDHAWRRQSQLEESDHRCRGAIALGGDNVL